MFKLKVINNSILLSLAILFVVVTTTFANGAFIGEDATLTAQGKWELETNFIWMNQSNDPGSHKSYGGELRINRGLRDNLDVSIITSFLSVNPYSTVNESGIGDTKLIFKRKLTVENQKPGEDLSLYLDLKLPTGDESKSLLLGTGQSDYGIGLSYQLKEEKNLYRFSGGYKIIGDPDNIDYKNIFNYSFGLERETDGGIIALAEVYGESRKHEAEETSTMMFMVGAKKELTKNKTFHIGLAFGVTESSPDLYINSGVKFKF
jgi:hypothetical protein